MALLTYTAIASLDGYVEDAAGDFSWAAPDAEVHAFVNDLMLPMGTYLYGRRLYDTMVFWDDPANVAGEGPEMRDFSAMWRAAEKVVYSRTLEAPRSERTRGERSFAPAEVRRLADAADREVSIGGAELAGQALAAGIVDEVGLVLVPAVVGGGARALPDGVRLDLGLLDERGFAGGAVYLGYRLR